MAPDPEEFPPEDFKIFPRNLTARAAYVVPGNPVQSRPESGVDNTHPGLEFDKRNLDRGFFPGLWFDFQFKLGARVSAIHPEQLAPEAGLRAEDLDAGLFLWDVWGHFGDRPDVPRPAALFGVDGYDVLRKVHDLEPGRLAVVIGREDLLAMPPDEQDRRRVAGRALCAQFVQGAQPSGVSVREPGGRIEYAVLCGERAAYLDDNGVIDPASFEPGVLTESLCSPWQWDFADCGCYYWAASRPDIVMGETGQPQTLNYQRSPGAQPPADMRNWSDWMGSVINQPQMIAGWERLPVVTDDTERQSGVVMLWTPRRPQKPEPTSLEDIAGQLTHLAKVEHAVCVQFLYAHYSVNLPRDGDAAEAEALRRVAVDMMRLAREEMQHMRWVHDALALLGQPPSLGRAEALRVPGNRAIASQTDAVFALRPLTDEALATFIAIEGPSRNPDPQGGPTGLYIELLKDVETLRGEAATPAERAMLERLREIVKLLIDEGGDHAKQLRYMAALVKPIPLERRLRVHGTPDVAAGPAEAGPLRDQADAQYAAMLAALARAYARGAQDRPAALGEAMTAMQGLDQLGRQLAALGAGLRFTLPGPP